MSFHCRAQEFYGKWTMDWSSLTQSDEVSPSGMTTAFTELDANNSKIPVWEFSQDSLKVYQAGRTISTAAIKWIKPNKFELLGKNNSKKKIHVIVKVAENRILMKTTYSNAQLNLRKIL